MASTYISQHGDGPVVVAVFGVGDEDIEAVENRQSPDLVSLRIGPHLSITGPLADLQMAATDMLNALATISVRRAMPVAERYAVRPLRNNKHGAGWTVWDLAEDKATGWFATRGVAEQTAATINDDPGRHAALFASVDAGLHGSGVDYPPLAPLKEYPLHPDDIYKYKPPLVWACFAPGTRTNNTVYDWRCRACVAVAATAAARDGYRRVWWRVDHETATVLTPLSWLVARSRFWLSEGGAK